MKSPLRLRAAAAVAALFLVSSPAASAAVRALIVGINDYGSEESNLSSCVEDARAMARLLEKTYGVPKENIRVLLDRQATSEGIEAAFRETLVKGVSAEDEVLFYFSGHGALMPNLTTVTARRVDKAMVPAGLPKPPLAWEKLVPQARLDGWLAESPARRQVVVLDCCHSGALTRSMGADPAFRPKVLDLGFGAAEAALPSGEDAEPLPLAKAAGGKTVLWMGACESRQVSYCGRPNSLFTGRLLKALQASPKAPVRDLYPDVAKGVVSASSGLPQGPQNPQTEGATEQPLLLTALSVATVPSPTPASAIPASTPSTNRNTSIYDSLTLANRTNATVTLDSLRIAPTRIPPASNPFQVKARLDKSVYVTNELPVLTLESSEDAYVRVFIISADASQTQVFPNRWQPDNRVRKGEAFRIPGAAENRWRLRITEPFGTEIVLVQARREQFADLAKGAEYAGLFMDLGSESPAQSRARGMKAEEAAPPPVAPAAGGTTTASPRPEGRAEAMVSYQVVPAR